MSVLLRGGFVGICTFRGSSRDFRVERKCKPAPGGGWQGQSAWHRDGAGAEERALDQNRDEYRLGPLCVRFY